MKRSPKCFYRSSTPFNSYSQLKWMRLTCKLGRHNSYHQFWIRENKEKRSSRFFSVTAEWTVSTKFILHCDRLYTGVKKASTEDVRQWMVQEVTQCDEDVFKS